MDSAATSTLSFNVAPLPAVTRASARVHQDNFTGRAFFSSQNRFGDGFVALGVAALDRVKGLRLETEIFGMKRLLLDGPVTNGEIRWMGR